MAENPLINDEEALSYIEGIENWTRGLKYLGDVVRYVRNHRKDIPILQEQHESVLATVNASQREAKSWADKLEQIKQEHKTFADASEIQRKVITQRYTEMSDEVSKMTEEKNRLEQEVHDLSAEVSRLQNRKDSLESTIADLEPHVKSLEGHLESVRSQAEAILKR